MKRMQVLEAWKDVIQQLIRNKSSRPQIWLAIFIDVKEYPESNVTNPRSLLLIAQSSANEQRRNLGK